MINFFVGQMSLRYYHGEISIFAVLLTKVLLSVTPTKRIGLVSYGLAVSFVCFLNNFQVSLRFQSESCLC